MDFFLSASSYCTLLGASSVVNAATHSPNNNSGDASRLPLDVNEIHGDFKKKVFEVVGDGTAFDPSLSVQKITLT